MGTNAGRCRRIGVVLVLAAVCAASTSGCYGYVIRSGAQQTTPSNGSIGVTWLWGLIGTAATAAECTGGLAYAATYMPWWSFLVAGLTGGVVTPMQSEWACAGGGGIQPMVIEVPLQPSKEVEGPPSGSADGT